jgi:hypothetical protein
LIFQMFGAEAVGPGATETGVAGVEVVVGAVAAVSVGAAVFVLFGVPVIAVEAGPVFVGAACFAEGVSEGLGGGATTDVAVVSAVPRLGTGAPEERVVAEAADVVGVATVALAVALALVTAVPEDVPEPPLVIT